MAINLALKLAAIEKNRADAKRRSRERYLKACEEKREKERDAVTVFRKSG